MSEFSKAAFSRAAGVSKAAITKSISSGKLKLNSNNKIDDTDKLTISYLKKHKSKKKKSPPKNKQAEKLKKIVPPKEKKIIDKISKSHPKLIKPLLEAAEKMQDDASVDPKPEQLNLSEISLDQADKYDLEKMKLKEQIIKERIKTDEIRGKLISRDFVKRFFLKLYNIDQNQFLQLEHSLGSKICDYFKTTKEKDLVKTTEILHDELYKTQKHIKLEIDKFLVGLGGGE